MLVPSGNFDVQDRKHIFRIPMKDPKHDAVTFLHALRELEQDEELAKRIGEGGRRVIEEVLTVANVQR